MDNSYKKLPERFYEKINPEKVSEPKLIKFNEKLAKELNLELDEKDLAKIFSGQKLMEGSEPIAQAYAGHQFGHFSPQLGDGRAHLLGEVIDKNGERRDIQLKGSGRTSFSRGGDGKAWLGPVIREYIVSEAMNALGILTTRALAAVSTGDEILRETRLPGAIVTRVAASHIRVGTFEFFAARKDHEAIKLLADYVIERHYPELKGTENPYIELFKAFAKGQSELVCQWMSVGFIHGVMNTDNCTVSGETIDYGPCAFMDFFDYNQVFSSIDQHGRYAYGNQPNIILWNISCFGNTLISLIDEDQKKAIELLNECMKEITSDLEKSVKLHMVKKIGLELEHSQLLIDFLAIIQKYRADFTLAFRSLSDLIEEDSNTEKFVSLFDDKEHRDEVIPEWLSKWRKLNPDLTLMNKVNPVYIPRNHLVEKAIENAFNDNDFQMMDDLVECLENPYEEQDKFKEFLRAPCSKDGHYVTYCGT